MANGFHSEYGLARMAVFQRVPMCLVRVMHAECVRIFCDAGCRPTYRVSVIDGHNLRCRENKKIIKINRINLQSYKRFELNAKLPLEYK